MKSAPSNSPRSPRYRDVSTSCGDKRLHQKLVTPCGAHSKNTRWADNSLITNANAIFPGFHQVRSGPSKVGLQSTTQRPRTIPYHKAGFSVSVRGLCFALAPPEYTDSRCALSRHLVLIIQQEKLTKGKQHESRAIPLELTLLLRQTVATLSDLGPGRKLRDQRRAPISQTT